MASILVIGGTRFFGQRVVERLLSVGHEVTIFTRGHSRPPFWDQVRFLQGDRSDHVSFKKIVNRNVFDVVIDNISMNEMDALSAVEAFSNRVQQYIMCSTIGVYPNWQATELLREFDANLNLRTGYSYADGKRAAEAVLQKSQLPYTILRPTVVEGEGDYTLRTWYWLQRLLDGKPVLVPRTEPETMLQNVYVEDVANAFEQVLLREGCFQQAYNVGGGEALSLMQYVQCLRDSADLDSQLVELSWSQCKEARLEFPSFFMNVRLLPDLSKARRDFNYSPKKVLDWLPQVVAELVHNKSRLPNSLGYQHRKREIELCKNCI